MIKDLQLIRKLLKTRKDARKGLARHLQLRCNVFRMFEFPHLWVLRNERRRSRNVPDYINQRWDWHYSDWKRNHLGAITTRQEFLNVLDETRASLNGIPLYKKWRWIDFTRNKPNETDTDRRRWEELGNWEQEPAFMEMSW